MEKAYEPIHIFCSSCGAPAKFDISGQVYRCAYCGGETGIREPLAEKQGFRRVHRARLEAERRTFPVAACQCTGCGATVAFPEGDALADCAFCGRSLVRHEYLKTKDFPELLIPFSVTEEQAAAALLAWCAENRGKREAREIELHIGELKGFYLPYELIKGPVDCAVSRRESGTYRCRGFLEGSFVNTSRQLDNLLLDGVEPFDLSEVKEFSFSYLAGQRVKVRDTDDKETGLRAAEEIASKYRPYAARVMETRGVTVTADIANMLEMSAVLPVYYLRAGDTLAAVNGQTGKVAVRAQKDRFLLPWWIKPLLGTAGFSALAYAVMRLFGADHSPSLFVAQALALFLLIVLFVAYHNQYGGLGREQLPRRIFASDSRRETVEPPEFHMPIDGRDQPVDIRFTTPFRLLKMVLLPFTLVFLPLIIAFVLNGLSFKGLTVAGAAVWLCITVPLAPVFVLKYGRLDLYRHPLIYYRTARGHRKRYWEGRMPLRERFKALKELVFSPLILLIAFLLITLVVNVYLILNWDAV